MQFSDKIQCPVGSFQTWPALRFQAPVAAGMVSKRFCCVFNSGIWAFLPWPVGSRLGHPVQTPLCSVWMKTNKGNAFPMQLLTRCAATGDESRRGEGLNRTPKHLGTDSEGVCGCLGEYWHLSMPWQPKRPSCWPRKNTQCSAELHSSLPAPVSPGLHHLLFLLQNPGAGEPTSLQGVI